LKQLFPAAIILKHIYFSPPEEEVRGKEIKNEKLD